MNRRILLFTLAAACAWCMLPGCAIFGDRKKTGWDIPSNLAGMAAGEIARARDLLQSVDKLAYDERPYLKVVVVKGERKVDGRWCWLDKIHTGRWIYGMCGRGSRGSYIIQVAGDPNTLGAVAPDVVRHEGAHYWRMSNYNDYGHLAKYASKFAGWRDTPAARATVTGPVDGVITVVDVLPVEEI